MDHVEAKYNFNDTPCWKSGIWGEVKKRNKKRKRFEETKKSNPKKCLRP